MLLALVALSCGPKKYVLLSPEDNYSDDANVAVRVGQVLEVQKGRTEVSLEIENKGTTPIDVGAGQATLSDPDDKPMPILGKPSGEIAAGATKTVTWAFDTNAASKGTFDFELSVPGVSKIYGIIFSTAKPPDFRPTPAAPENGPQGPPMPGGGGGY